jgi:hypothetical protein
MKTPPDNHKMKKEIGVLFILRVRAQYKSAHLKPAKFNISTAPTTSWILLMKKVLDFGMRRTLGFLGRGDVIVMF